MSTALCSRRRAVFYYPPRNLSGHSLDQKLDSPPQRYACTNEANGAQQTPVAMSMAQITSSREDITDRHVQSAFAGVVSGFSVLAGTFYASLYLPMMWRLVAISVAIPLLMWKARAWVKAQNKPPRRVLMMLSNHETGYDADEARVAADAFEEWGMEPVWCSLQGGAAPSVKGMTGVEGDDETVPLARCPAADFVALYLVGGPGPAFEWVKSAPLHARVAEILQQGGTVGACGTGVAGLSEVVQRVSGDHVLYITGAKVTLHVETRAHPSLGHNGATQTSPAPEGAPSSGQLHPASASHMCRTDRPHRACSRPRSPKSSRLWTPARATWWWASSQSRPSWSFTLWPLPPPPRRPARGRCRLPATRAQRSRSDYPAL